MRIFCAVRHSNDPRFFYGGLWSGNFYPGLRGAGHEIVEAQTDLRPTSEFMGTAGNFNRDQLRLRAQTTEHLLDELREAHHRKPIHLFLSYFYNSHFDPSGFGEIRRLGIPSINFYCNSIYQFDLVRDIAVQADYAWHPEKEARQTYLAAGAKPVWVQMGADPGVYRPMKGVLALPSICFVGQRYADRDRWLTALIRAGIPVEIYGAGWLPGDGEPAGPAAGKHRAWTNRLQPVRQNFGAHGIAAGIGRTIRQYHYLRETQALVPIWAPHARGPATDIASVFAKHEICLNLSNVWADGRPCSALVSHVRLRDFEGPMCRTCYLTGESEEISEFYEVGKEIDTYGTAEELLEKAKFYLQHPEPAEALRAAGYGRALRDHTWKRRFEELFVKAGITKTPVLI